MILHLHSQLNRKFRRPKRPGDRSRKVYTRMGFEYLHLDPDRRMARIAHSAVLVYYAHSCHKRPRSLVPKAHRRFDQNDSWLRDYCSYILRKNINCKKTLRIKILLTFTGIGLLPKSWLPGQVVVKVFTKFAIQTLRIVSTLASTVYHIVLSLKSIQR